jgi:hypothetical protein
MVDRAAKKFGSFLEKFLLWVLEGEPSPFNRAGAGSPETGEKPIRKKRIRKNGIV